MHHQQHGSTDLRSHALNGLLVSCCRRLRTSCWQMRHGLVLSCYGGSATLCCSRLADGAMVLAARCEATRPWSAHDVAAQPAGAALQPQIRPPRRARAGDKPMPQTQHHAIKDEPRRKHNQNTDENGWRLEEALRDEAARHT